MPTLDRIMQLQSQGMSDSEISRQLQNEGVNVREINDSLNQAKIKSAVQDTAEMQQQGMQQSIMQSQEQDNQEQYPQTKFQNQQYAQPDSSPQSYQSLDQYPSQTQQYPEYYPETPQAYSGQEQYPQSAGLDSDTITEIAEQIVMEKFAEFSSKTGDLVFFKSEIQDKIKDLNERLKSIESSIENLQQAVISRIGEFGESTSAIHKNLNSVHDTMSKLMNPLIDNYKELKKIAGKK